MNRNSSVRDVTGLQRTGGGGSDMRQLFMCGHKALDGVRRPVAGRAPILWKCAACAAKGKA